MRPLRFTKSKRTPFNAHHASSKRRSRIPHPRKSYEHDSQILAVCRPSTCPLGLLAASLFTAAACVTEPGGGGGGGGGEEGERPACEPTDGVCASGASSNDDGDDSSSHSSSSNNGSCGSTGNGELFCDSKILYEGVNGSKREIVDCRGCKYVGPGTGSTYKTSCKAERNLAWEYSFPSEAFPGPGCYFGSSLICD